MSEASNALGAIVGLLLGGIIFVTFGSALAQTETAATWPVPLDFRLWGVIYIAAAVILGIAIVVAAIIAFFNTQ